MRAAKSRSKTEDPEQAKLKAKVSILTERLLAHLLKCDFRFCAQAKEMQRAEMEELRQRDANLTALQAIGPRKKPKLESDATASSAVSCLDLISNNNRCERIRFRVYRLAAAVWARAERQRHQCDHASNESI